MEYVQCLKDALRHGVSLETFNNFWEMEVSTARINAQLKLTELAQSDSSSTQFGNEKEIPVYLNDKFHQLQQQLLDQRELMLAMFEAIQNIHKIIDIGQTFSPESKAKTTERIVKGGLVRTEVEESISKYHNNSGAILEWDNNKIINFSSRPQGESCSNITAHVQHQIVGDVLLQDQIVGGGLHQDQIVGGSLHQDQIVGGGLQQDQIVGGGLQLDQIVGGSLHQDQIVGGGLQQDQIVGGGLQQYQIVRGGLQQDQIVGGGLQQYQIVGGGLQQYQIVGGGLQKDQIVGGGLQLDQIVGGGLQQDHIVGGGLQQDQIVGGGLQQDQIVGGGLQQDQIVGGGLQQDQIVGGDLQQFQILGGGLQQDQIAENSVQQHQILDDDEQKKGQTVTCNDPSIDQNTTGDRVSFKSRRKTCLRKLTTDLQNQDQSDQQANQTHESTAAKTSDCVEEQEVQAGVMGSTLATGMYAEAIAQQISALGGNKPSLKHVPRFGAYFEVANVTQAVDENLKLYTDSYLTAPATCAVRLMFTFDKTGRLVVTLLFSGSPVGDSLWPVYINGEGKVFNFKSKRYTYLWRVEALKVDKPGDDLQVQCQVKTCLETLKGSLYDVTYEQLLKRNYEKSNKMNFCWKVGAFHEQVQ